MEQVDEGFMDVDELATFLNLNRKSVYQAIERGEIPGVTRFGRTIRIYRPTVLEWAKSDKPKRRW
jgi:excisionase family DNA binding protein